MHNLAEIYSIDLKLEHVSLFTGISEPSEGSAGGREENRIAFTFDSLNDCCVPLEVGWGGGCCT